MLVKLIKNSNRNISKVEYNQSVTDECIKYAKLALNMNMTDPKSWYILGWLICDILCDVDAHVYLYIYDTYRKCLV